MVKQFEELQSGEEYIVMQTNYGDIKIKLFPESAPKTVENFVTHVKNGYYNGVIFHRVIDDFMIQGGDPTGTGLAGESIWGEPFEDEIDLGLRHFRGALSMANGGPNSNGSQFFIVQKGPLEKGYIQQMREIGAEGGYPDEMVDVFETIGGAYWLDGKHTVFGQVFDGMDVVDEIASLSTNANDRPEKDVFIQHIMVKKKE